jgi:hypothetical protein
MSRNLYSPRIIGGANGRKKAHSASAAENEMLIFKRSIVVVPLFLPRENSSFGSGKNNGVVCADVMCHFANKDQL